MIIKSVVPSRKKLVGVAAIFPGANGTADGYGYKYAKIADMLAEHNIASLRTDNPVDHGWPLSSYKRATELLRATHDLVVEYDPAMFFVAGISAGASVMAALMGEWKQYNIFQLLLIAPSTDAGRSDVIDGIRQYSARLSVVVGENDRVVGTKWPQEICSHAVNANVSYKIVPGADHQFRGRDNGYLFSQAFLWAMTDMVIEYPNLNEAGVYLYG